MSLFSKNLRFLRRKGKYNQDEIAILFHKRANTIGNWENEKSEPSLEELVKLGEFFRVSSSDLLQKDIEMEFRVSGTEGDGHSAGLSSSPPDSFAPPEALTTPVLTSGPDTFRMILLELRALHRKVDLLMAGMESASFKSNSDKSYY